MPHSKDTWPCLRASQETVTCVPSPLLKWEGLDASDGDDLPPQLLVRELLNIGHDTNLCVEIMIELVALPCKAADTAAVNERRILQKISQILIRASVCAHFEVLFEFW
jgi:hypothetical protein